MITIILVVYKPKKNLLENFLRKINKKNNFIIVNVARFGFYNYKLPKNTKIINTKNNGYGAAINLALRQCRTKYALISQIDVYFKKSFIDKFYKFSKKVKNFAILIPNEKNKSSRINLKENTDGEASTMLIDISKIRKIKFDENIFLYFEETDLFHRCKKKHHKVLDVNNFKIHKKRASSISYKNNNIEYVMKWHYMWSMFYFYKKNFGYISALKKTSKFLIKDLIVLLISIFFFDFKKMKLRFFRLYGLISSILGLKSFLRP